MLAQYRLTVDIPVEDEQALEDMLGQVDTGAGQVAVKVSGQVGEVVTFKVEGHVPAIVAWLINTWESEDLALQEIADACGPDHRLEMI